MEAGSFFRLRRTGDAPVFRTSALVVGLLKKLIDERRE
jgi:hypothetical protein